MRLSGAIKVCAQFSSITNVCVCDPLRCTIGARCNGVLEFAICLLEFISPFKPATEQTLVFFIAPFNKFFLVYIFCYVYVQFFGQWNTNLIQWMVLLDATVDGAHVLILQPGRVPIREASAAKRGCAQVWTVSGSIISFIVNAINYCQLVFFKVKCNIVKLLHISRSAVCSQPVILLECKLK